MKEVGRLLIYGRAHFDAVLSIRLDAELAVS
jgi:hypothetical protein